MRFDIFFALLMFCVVGGVTPGPNNMMLMASGVNFGVRRTLPHLAGVVLGFTLMVALVGFGLDAIFRVAPWLLPAMRWAGAAYLLWLAWRIANSGAVKEGAATAQPLGALAAAAFQWINPKGWVMAVSALTTYAVSAELRDQRDRRRRDVPADRLSVQRRLGVVRRGDAPLSRRSPPRPAVQLDDGGAAGRLDRAGVLGVSAASHSAPASCIAPHKSTPARLSRAGSSRFRNL